MAGIWWSVYLLGAVGWLAVILLAFLRTPAVETYIRALEGEGLSRRQALTLLLIACSVLWPITVPAAVATGIIGGRR